MKLARIKYLIISLLLMVVLVSCGGTTDPSNYVYKTPKTDELKLTRAWEGKDFLTDGIGAVKVVQNVDGDTTIVKPLNKNVNLTLRYLGIDTPESTYKVEPWGFAASDFTKGKLKSAETIVIESDPLTTVQDTNGRYLAWVWYRETATSDFRLLNLELVENAYSPSKAVGLTYSDYFARADYDVQKAGCRYWGETDPSYDSTKIGQLYTIKEIRESFTTLNVTEQRQHMGKVVRISGIVSRATGIGSAYIQQYDEETKTYYGIYVYGGFTTSVLENGREVVVSGKIGYYNGGLQLTDLDRDNTSIVSINNEIHTENITAEEFNKGEVKLQGQLVKLTNLKVTGGRNTAGTNGLATKAYSIYVESESGQKIEIRVDKNTTIKIAGENLVDGEESRIIVWNYFEGRTITEITGLVGWYSYLNDDETAYKNDGLQLLLVSGADIVLAPAA